MDGSMQPVSLGIAGRLLLALPYCHVYGGTRDENDGFYFG
jgi:hypothetical protein